MVRPFPESYSDRNAISAYINKGDLRLTNLETTITDLNRYGSAYSGGTWVAAEENVLAELSELGFNCFGISNNHTMDYSYEGLHQTLDALDRAGLAHAGAGCNRDEAEAPALVKTPNGTFAVISVCSTFNMAAAAGAATPYLPGRPGLNYLRFVPVFQVHAQQLQALKELGSSVNINGLKELHRAQGFETALPEGIYEFGGNWFRAVPDDQPIGRTSHCNAKDLQRICESVRRAKEMADAVIVQIHSHEVKTDCDEEADFFMEECARACIDAGASAIVGGGTHQLKGIEVYKGCPIFYSLGNFVFQNSLVAKLPADFLEKYGLPLTATAPEAIRARSATA
ncbi:MAG: CapA family protein, partial [Oscillospiraceae bacterium]|nr:CapA family protein [Oscillospiraceae bacterium]